MSNSCCSTYAPSPIRYALLLRDIKTAPFARFSEFPFSNTTSRDGSRSLSARPGYGKSRRESCQPCSNVKAAGGKIKHRQALIAHIDKLEPITRKVDSGADTDEHHAFSISGRTLEQLYRDMVLADSPL
jgi:hypothetical protein